MHKKGSRQELCVFLLLLEIGFMLAGCSTKPTPSFTLNGSLPLRSAKTISAGEPTTITVGPRVVADGMPVTLIATGSYGLRIYQAVFRHREAQFFLSGKETQQSGVVNLTALAGKARGSTQLLIQPSTPVEPLTPLIGARAIIADAQHWSMTVLIAFDTFGNPVAEGTQVEVLALHPDGRLEKKVIEVHHLLAWVRIFSDTKAGRTLIATRIGPIHGSEGTLLEVAGWPVPFSISADPQPLPADGRLITMLRTAPVLDRFGNAVPDGTLVTFIVYAPDGSFSTVPAYTIGGIAEAPLQAPLQPGSYIAQATILGMESKKTTIVFIAGATTNTFTISVQHSSIDNTFLLRAGPLLGSLGQFIPDGTPVRFIITNARGQSQELDSISDAGYAQVELFPGQFPAGVYTTHVIAGSGQALLKFTLRR